MSYTIPTVDDFKDYFTRDFPYGGSSDKVTDDDIQKGIDDATAFVNEALFDSQTTFNVGFLNLSAHFMVESLRASSQGVNGSFSFLQNSRSVGSVSESIALPDRILANPEFSMLSKTNYGAKYLMLVLPGLSGQIYTVCGRTHP